MNRYILVGPVNTLEALHETLREYQYTYIIGIYSDHTLFKRRWYATLDTSKPDFTEFVEDFDGNGVLFTGISINMA